MEKKFEGQGFAFFEDGKSIRVGSLPGRKKICVYEDSDDGVSVLAYCANHEMATKMLDWLNRLYEE